MKSYLVICMAVLLLFSACGQTTASISFSSEPSSISSSAEPEEHPSSCEPPEPDEAPSAQTVSVQPTVIQYISDPNSETQAVLYSDGSVSLRTDEKELLIETPDFDFSSLGWNQCGWLLFLSGEDVVKIYQPISETFTDPICIGVPLITNE